MATVASLLHLVRRRVRNAPQPAIEDAIVYCAREFCRESRWLRETAVYDIDHVALAASQFLTLAPVMAQCEILGVKAVEVSEHGPLDQTAFEEREQTTGTADSYIFEPPNALWFAELPTLTVVDGLAVRQILQPIESATEIPDYLLREWREDIASGAIARLFMEKGASYYSPKDAGPLMDDFHIAKHSAKTTADRGHRTRGGGASGFRTKPWP